MYLALCILAFVQTSSLLGSAFLKAALFFFIQKNSQGLLCIMVFGNVFFFLFKKTYRACYV